MSTELTEDEMRRALGLDTVAPAAAATPAPVPVPEPAPPRQEEPKPRATAAAKARATAKRPSPLLRVTLRVTKEFEGEEVLFVHDANTLSTFDAEQQAKKAAAKEKYKYFELVSVKPF